MLLLHLVVDNLSSIFTLISLWEIGLFSFEEVLSQWGFCSTSNQETHIHMQAHPAKSSSEVRQEEEIKQR